MRRVILGIALALAFLVSAPAAVAADLGTAYVLGWGLGRPAVGTAGAAVAALVLGGVLLASIESLNGENHVNFPFISAALLVGGAVVGIVLPRVVRGPGRSPCACSWAPARRSSAPSWPSCSPRPGRGRPCPGGSRSGTWARGDASAPNVERTCSAGTIGPLLLLLLPERLSSSSVVPGGLSA